MALLFIGAGIVGILYYGSLFKRTPPALSVTVAPVLAQLAPTASSSILGKLLLFFLKAGSLTFGSGLVIVPFLEQGLVQQFGWLDQRQFLIAVAIGMISPGPVVITATFVGYLVAGFWGSLVSTIGIFLPSFLLVLIAAPLLARHRGDPNVQGFVKGAYAAAIGTIVGACILLGRVGPGVVRRMSIAAFEVGGERHRSETGPFEPNIRAKVAQALDSWTPVCGKSEPTKYTLENKIHESILK